MLALLAALLVWPKLLYAQGEGTCPLQALGLSCQQIMGCLSGTCGAGA